MTSFLQTQASQLLSFLASQGVDLINFAVLEARKSGDGTCMKGGDRPRRRPEVEKSLGWASIRNAQGAAVYWRPARRLEDGAPASWPTVFLDDLPPAIVTGIAGKYRCATIETSSNNFQAWIIVNRPLSEAERRQVQVALAGRVGADPGSVSGEHFGRFPGFRNMKPGRGGHWISIRAINTTSPTLDPTPYLSSAAGASQSAPAPFSPPTGGRVSSSSADETDESAREFRFAVARLAAGDPTDVIVERIAARAHARGKRNSFAGCTAYAERTVEKARAWRG